MIDSIKNDTERVFKALKDKGLVLATAESCTGGLVSACITDIEGSSVIFDRTFVTYSNDAKVDMLSVSRKSLLEFGAVSETVAKEMLAGAIKHSTANIAVAITGIAGPGGGTIEKPVGTVCFAWGNLQTIKSSTECFDGDRQQVRIKAVEYAFQQLIAFIPSYG